MLNFQRMPDPFATKGGNLFEYWVSFWPVAPYFGVEWRFAPLFQPLAGFTSMAEQQMDSALSAAGDTIDKAMKKSKKAVETATATVVEETKAAMTEAAELATQVGDMPQPMQPSKPKVAKVKAVEPAPAPVAEPAPEISPASLAVVEPAPAAGGKPSTLMAKAPASPDDLKMIKGIGPKLEAELNELGVWTFKQMAGFSEADLTWIDDNLSAFKGRCFRDDWTGQAKALMG